MIDTRTGGSKGFRHGSSVVDSGNPRSLRVYAQDAQGLEAFEAQSGEFCFSCSQCARGIVRLPSGSTERGGIVQQLRKDEYQQVAFFVRAGNLPAFKVLLLTTMFTGFHKIY